MVDILAVALNPTIDVSCEADHVRPTKKTRTQRQRLDPGGGGVNVARAVHALGGNSELLVLSGGATGLVLEQFLKEIPIVTHKITMAEDVRVAVNVHEKATGFEYRFVPEGPAISPNLLDEALEIIDKFQGGYVVASGSLPRGLPVDSYCRMAEIVTSNGARFILDTSGEALCHTLDNSSFYLVKPSLGELEDYSGKQLDEQGAQDVAQDLVTRGAAENVAVTLGAQGAFLAGREGMLRMPSLHVVTRSAVGAGDSFVAGMVHALTLGRTMEEAFRFGIAAGSAAVMTPGSELCRREDVDAILAALT